MYLDVQSDYGFLKAYGSIEQIIKRAESLGHKFVGICDDCSTWGHAPLQSYKTELRKVFGCRINVCVELDKDARYDQVSLLALDQDGLREQYEALTLATGQFYYAPRLTWDQLSKVSGNIILLHSLTPRSAPLAARLERAYIAARPERGFTLTQALRGFLPAIPTASPLYPTADDEESWRLYQAISSAKRTDSIDRSRRWMMSEPELDIEFQKIGVDTSEWKSNLEKISEQFFASIPQGVNVKPEIDTTVEEWCEKGASIRGIDLHKEPYKSRYQREIALIHEKGFADYFLLIADLVAWAKQRMFVGPARGSSAGSLVCYLMEIVEVDPLKHGLLFERFIDINRYDLPDIDIDFPDDRRDEVFRYIVDKYGADRVARIGTVSVFKPKSALNDTAKCYNIPPWELKAFTEVLVERSGGDARANMAIEDSINHFEVGKELSKKYPNILQAAKIEGHARHTGQHAAGVMVSNDTITKYCAINRRNDQMIGMLNKNDAEALGLLKIDALGLKTLSVIQDCCDMAGVNPRDLYTLPLDIEEAFQPFKEDRVAGIFQFEGYAVRSLMRQMGVSEFNDIVALTALARPGPLHCGAANQFVARKKGEEDWSYEIPQLEAHVKDTLGTIVYQEQVMTITRDIGKMSWQDVSALRKAMSKSLGEEFFNKYKDKFISGASEHGIDAKKAGLLWDNMCTFGSWAFNLSHAVSYALISYWCGYLKAKYPIEFAVAHLRRSGDDDHTLRMLRELVKEGVKFIPFDKMTSLESWTIKDGIIYGGLTAVKGIGEKWAQKILELREAGGEWEAELPPHIRAKLNTPNNTKWSLLDRLHKKYEGIYKGEKTEWTKGGTTDKVVNIEDIEEVKGTYTFIGTLKQRNLRDLNETQSVAKRGGEIITHNTLFLNLTFEDDTSSILATINRWAYPKIGAPLMEEAADGYDFLIKGDIIEDGRRKIYISKIKKLGGPD